MREVGSGHIVQHTANIALPPPTVFMPCNERINVRTTPLASNKIRERRGEVEGETKGERKVVELGKERERDKREKEIRERRR
jgi:hypothetical protein